MITLIQSTASVCKVYFLLHRALIILSIICCLCKTLSAQDIPIRNPSFEGTAGLAIMPAEWVIGSKSPDTQPCYNRVDKLASDGNTYVGAMHDDSWDETFGQKLSSPLKAGKIYTFSFDIAYPPIYYTRICAGSLGIYGGNGFNSKDDTLWLSGEFYNTGWQRKEITIRPKVDCDYLLFSPYITGTCDSSKYSAMLLDNLSESIREVPQIEVSVSKPCKNSNNGTAAVRVKAGEGPYTYRWIPGNFSDSTVSHLAPGWYTVRVTSANGTSAEQKVVIGEYEVQVKASLVNNSCYNSDNGAIYLTASGGVSPYAFSIDGGASYSSSSIFTSLPAGSYNVKIKDAANCNVVVNKLKITAPDELKILNVTARNIACNTVQNGSIALTVQGGTPNYVYSIIGAGSEQSDSIFTGLNDGKYRIRVTDGNYCMVEGEAEISRETRGCALYLPTAFSPNGDGKNDIFRAVVHDDVKEFRMAVYGRWGEMIFETKDPERGWDGMFKGNMMPAGHYVYMVTYTDSHGQDRKQTGTLVMVR
ncbi:T9SS type B sorting domain-containing protein [Chitinophaga silvisoli]|uniref:Gliding motility-associated C-terminal domain-containing protein n=1 Tax=Chitinophaga silvisoli TaxID=2291814 RepID=A0A3E1P0L2_9BACT|nr:gliding motility-associated C-terminal domain-containing protein [Chitinophaga silvisoli]RFM33654.1 hypothetical protein DXN04_16980 [Chitinophaga silvisoli]